MKESFKRTATIIGRSKDAFFVKLDGHDFISSFHKHLSSDYSGWSYTTLSRTNINVDSLQKHSNDVIEVTMVERYEGSGINRTDLTPESIDAIVNAKYFNHSSKYKVDACLFANYEFEDLEVLFKHGHRVEEGPYRIEDGNSGTFYKIYFEEQGNTYKQEFYHSDSMSLYSVLETITFNPVEDKIK